MLLIWLLTFVGCAGGEDPEETGQTVLTVADGTCALQTDNALRIDCRFDNLAGTESMVLVTTGATTQEYATLESTTSVWGLLAQTEYTIVVTNVAGEQLHDQVVTTGALPADLVITATVSGTAGIEAVLIQDCASKDRLVMFDTLGNIIWYQNFSDLVPNTELHGYSLTQDGSIMVTTGRTGIAEVSLGGALMRTIDLEDRGLEGLLHHDIHSRDGIIYALHAYQVGDYIFDGVYLFNDAGDLVGTIQSDDFLDGDAISAATGQAPPDHYWEVYFWTAESIGHANSVYRHDNGELLISFRFLNTIVSLNGDIESTGFGDVNWMLEGMDHDAIDGDYSLSSSVTNDLVIEAPHCAQLSASGALTIFDNGLGQDSRGVVLSLDGDTAEITGSYELPEQCAVQSSVFELDNKDVLMGCSESFNIYEFSPGKASAHWTMEFDTGCSSSGGGPPPMTPRAYPVELP